MWNKNRLYDNLESKLFISLISAVVFVVYEYIYDYVFCMSLYDKNVLPTTELFKKTYKFYGAPCNYKLQKLYWLLVDFHQIKNMNFDYSINKLKIVDGYLKNRPFKITNFENHYFVIFQYLNNCEYYFGFELTHKNLDNFSLLSEKDLNFYEKKQYISNELYVFDSDWVQKSFNHLYTENCKDGFQDFIKSYDKNIVKHIKEIN